MDVLRTAFIALAYALWILGLVLLVSSVFSGMNIFLTGVALVVIGLIFFGLHKVTARR